MRPKYSGCRKPSLYGKGKVDNIIYLDTAWQTGREPGRQPDRAWEREAPEGRPPKAERRRARRARMALMGGEWLATLSVVLVMAVMAVKLLLF